MRGNPTASWPWARGPQPALPASSTAEPLIGWRGWSVVRAAKGGGYLLGPANSWGVLWYPGQAMGARCLWEECGCRGEHSSPDPWGSCGLYAKKGSSCPDPRFIGVLWPRMAAAIGTVALWGRVIEHERGYRAQWAYPQRLRLVCGACMVDGLASAFHPDVVIAASPPARGIVGRCQEHLGAEERRHVLAQAREVEQSLLTRYAVDRLPAWEPGTDVEPRRH